jgi:hypothetical protein
MMMKIMNLENQKAFSKQGVHSTPLLATPARKLLWCGI